MTLENIFPLVKTPLISLQEFITELTCTHQEYIRASDGPFVTNMLRSELRDKNDKNKSQENLSVFKKQRNLCEKIIRNRKIHYYKNLDIKCLADNRSHPSMKLRTENVQPSLKFEFYLVTADNVLQKLQELRKTLTGL